MDLSNIRTYIQSGNVVFQSEADIIDDLATRIANAIYENHGFSPKILILKLGEFEAAIANNPYPHAEDNPKTLHLFFMESEPQGIDLETIESLKISSESFSVHGKVFYLHAPDGIGRSKLAARVEKTLGVPVTARNWRSVQKIFDLAVSDTNPPK